MVTTALKFMKKKLSKKAEGRWSSNGPVRMSFFFDPELTLVPPHKYHQYHTQVPAHY